MFWRDGSCQLGIMRIASKHIINCHSCLLFGTDSVIMGFDFYWSYTDLVSKHIFFYLRMAACAVGITSWELEILTCTGWAVSRWRRSSGSVATGWSWWSPGVLWTRIPLSLLSCPWCSPLWTNRWEGRFHSIWQTFDTNSYNMKMCLNQNAFTIWSITSVKQLLYKKL